LLYTQEAVAADGGRGLGSGRFFTPDGTHLATVAQEGMIRAAGLRASRPLSEGGPA
ncbi:thioesterase family protein, partial [Streptomyces scabiei]